MIAALTDDPRLDWPEVPQVARLFRVTNQTVYNWLERGMLRGWQRQQGTRKFWHVDPASIAEMQQTLQQGEA